MFDKPEFQPLLEPGLHVMTLEDLESISVNCFPVSSIRSYFMNNLRTLLALLARAKVVGEIWVDGSYLTKKIDPEDVDVVFRFPASEFEQASLAKKSSINWILHEDRRDDLRCHIYAFFEYSPSDPLYSRTQERYRYWLDQFGTDRKGSSKGIAVIQIPSEVPLPWTS